MKKETAGKHIPCRLCENEAVIILTEGRFYVHCYTCGSPDYLLKEHNLTKNPQSVGEIIKTI